LAQIALTIDDKPSYHLWILAYHLKNALVQTKVTKPVFLCVIFPIGKKIKLDKRKTNILISYNSNQEQTGGT